MYAAHASLVNSKKRILILTDLGTWQTDQSFIRNALIASIPHPSDFTACKPFELKAYPRDWRQKTHLCNLLHVVLEVPGEPLDCEKKRKRLISKWKILSSSRCFAENATSLPEIASRFSFIFENTSKVYLFIRTRRATATTSKRSMIATILVSIGQCVLCLSYTHASTVSDRG